MWPSSLFFYHCANYIHTSDVRQDRFLLRFHSQIVDFSAPKSGDLFFNSKRQ